MIQDIFRSFFRTLGRIIAYLFIGFLLALIFGKLNVKAYTDNQLRLNYNGTNLVDTHDLSAEYNGPVDYIYNNVSMNISSNTQYTFSAQYLIGFRYNANDTVVNITKDDIDTYIVRGGQTYSLQCSTSISNTITAPSSGNLYLKQFSINVTCNKFTTSATSQQVLIRFRVRQSHPSSVIGPPQGITKSAVIIQNLVLDRSDGLSDSDLIINNQNQNTNDIINNQDTNTDKIIDNQNKNQQETNEKLDEVNDTNKGILQTLIDLPKTLIQWLFSLIVPDNFDFLNGFLDALENKLGFIASVPIQMIDFLIDLVNVPFETMTSITMPGFSVLGYDLWSNIEIDLSDLIDTLSPYKIYTNIGCVCLVIRYLTKLYDNFANGGNS